MRPSVFCLVFQDFMFFTEVTINGLRDHGYSNYVSNDTNIKAYGSHQHSQSCVVHSLCSHLVLQSKPRHACPCQGGDLGTNISTQTTTTKWLKKLDFSWLLFLVVFLGLSVRMLRLV
ncbi:hypothetical protein P170DRAFT_196350 [Aspergillus steynii IBT 23096]|uniref:Uncharacterized protein n=1 Tax=Aspergillus steynii IBT 23096 TaxID=1392250 RepID=A0A2I2G4C8_9EURO|nr:uncharacterized protein P170DRAFT_196350 [Aspergillus steynii IBT 23096]PLB47731.1 hypothetical protein P170DRAFT_196350 [Aspergillus steynii IBT 23096]